MSFNTIQRKQLDRFAPNPFYVELPVDATIVAVQFRRDEPTIWYTCDGHFQTLINRTFEWIVTDGAVHAGYVYVATLQHYGTDYHLFELKS